MKKLLMIVMTASLALATGALAQQEEPSQPPKKKHPQAEHHPANEAHPSGNAQPGNEMHPAQHHGAAQNQHNEAVQQHNEAAQKQHNEMNAPAAASPAEATGVRARRANRQQQRAAQKKSEQNPPNEAPTANESHAKPAPAAAQTSESTTAHPGTANPPAKKMNAQVKKPDPQVVQQVKTQHASFKAQPKPDQVPAVTYNQSYRIQGAQQWQGSHYEVFRSYHPVWHDQGWYRAHYPRVEIIAGGAYYFSNGYWYPAWGYDAAAQYYAYDAPIYVGARAEPPDRVIADVQAILQQEGYYKGEVDGLLGPLTREALVGYQTDNGLYATAVIDEPTLASLDLS